MTAGSGTPGGPGLLSVVSAGLRGGVAGGITLAMTRLFLLRTFERATSSLECFLQALWLVTLLPAVILLVSVAGCVVLRLPLGWLVGILAPVLALVLLQPLPDSDPLGVGAILAVYVATAAAAVLVRAALRRAG